MNGFVKGGSALNGGCRGRGEKYFFFTIFCPIKHEKIEKKKLISSVSNTSS